jgi:cytoskeletal protein CcmA (bactofilin family)
LLAALLAVLFLAAPAGAMEFYSGGNVNLPEGKIEGPVFVAGDNVVINGEIDGDVFASGQTVTFNGKINGDLLAAGNTVRINGQVDGDARVVGYNITLAGEINGSFTAAAAELHLLKESRVNRDMQAAVKNLSMAGLVGRHFLGAGESISLDGPLGGNAVIQSVNNLTVGPGGSIAGQLSYKSGNQANIAPEAKIGGITNWTRLEAKEPQHRRGVNWLSQLAWFASGVLVWGVFTLIFPMMWKTLSKTIAGSPWAGLGWGVLALLATPLAILLLLITVVGIPISLTLAVVYAMLLYAGKLIVADAAGRYLSGRFGWEKRVPAIVPFMVGLAGLVLLTNIPIAGTVINIAVTALAMGAVALALYNWRKRPPAAPTAVE